MTRYDEVAEVAKAVSDTAIDLLILNAGILGEHDEEEKCPRRVGTLKREDFLNVFNVNVVGNVLLGL